MRQKDEFCTSANVFEIREERLIFFLKDLLQEEFATVVIELQKALSLHQQELPIGKSLDKAAEKIYEVTKSCRSKLNWPPWIKNLEQDQTYLTMQLKRFLCKLFNNNSLHEVPMKSVG